MTSEFDFRFDAAYRPAAKVFGVHEGSAMVTVSDTEVLARFGPWQVRTPISNIETVEITGPYRYVKTAGPARLSFRDRGLTFATNGTAGVLLSFVEPITGMDPWGRMKHPNLTVTVADVEGLRAALTPATPSS